MAGQLSSGGWRRQYSAASNYSHDSRENGSRDPGSRDCTKDLPRLVWPHIPESPGHDSRHGSAGSAGPLSPAGPRTLGFERQTSPAASNAASVPAQAPWSGETVSLMETSLGSLGPMAGNLCFVAAQPETTLAPLRGLGFCAVRSGASLGGDRLPDADAVLVASLGSEALDIRRVVGTLAQAPKRPTLIAFLVAPAPASRLPPRLPSQESSSSPVDGASPSALSVQTSIELGKNLFQARRLLLDAGADDVICLLEGEILMPHRLMETIQRSEFLAKQRRAEAVAAYSKYLWSLPGNVLEGIPTEDGLLHERHAEDGSLAGIGEYNFQDKLGMGSFGKVYKATHPEHGPVAVKAINKSSLTTVNMMVALNNELSVMRYIEAHPNVVKVLAVMCAARHYYAVMDYAGPLDLHKWTEQTLQSSGDSRLSQGTVKRFSAQQASAVLHLHRCLVSHRDLKPTNWVVSETGDTLRLTDFGLAIQLSGADQPLKYRCGSVPFCAPEVLSRSASRGKSGTAGYRGLAADIWSLAVGFIELACGSGTIFQLLGWEDRKPPQKDDDVVQELLKLEGSWACRAPESAQGLHAAISGMLVVDADKRFTIAQVVGPQGLGVELQARPPSVPRTAPKTHRAKTIRTSSLRRLVRRPSDSKADDLACEMARLLPEAPLTVRLGGPSVLQAAFGQVLRQSASSFEACGEEGEPSPDKMRALSSLLSQVLPVILDEATDSQRADAARMQVRASFKGVKVADSDFLTIANHLGAALQSCDVDVGTVEEALDRFETLRGDITGHRMSALSPNEIRGIAESWPAAAAA